MRLGLAGPTYQSQSSNVAADYAMNFYPEIVEIPNAKSRVVLYPTPGLSLFTALGGLRVRGMHEINDRCFAVVDATLYEIHGNGTSTNRGTVVDDAAPVSMAASPSQLLIASGSVAYVLNLTTNVLTTIAAGTLSNVSQVAYIDGYFIALNRESQTFRISTALDATSWPGLQIIAVSVFPDNVVAMISDHRELWILGRTKSIVYYDSGSTQIFDVIPGSHVEQGCGATFSPVNLDNTIFWLGRDKGGGAIAWRAEGFRPIRVSTHAVEHSWQGYGSVDDAISWTYQDRGHAFWVIYFPNADRTWVYDASTQMWHERGFLSGGAFQAHLGRAHAFAFNRHLVGARNSGNIYEMSLSFFDDSGSPIRRVRRASHLSNEEKWMFHHQLQLDLESGIGPIPPLTDGAGNARDPQVNLRWSDDGGHQWSNYHTADAGRAGEYRSRVIWRRLGRSRDRVYEVSMSDAVAWRLIDAYLELTPGNGA